MNIHKKQRIEILNMLYTRREAQPRKGWLCLNELKQAVGECDFALVYLVEKGQIKEDGYQYRITASGIDVVEALED